MTSTSAASVQASPLSAAVPWSTVLPLAGVLAYADGFWMTSLHGAVGAISRTQEPFTSYWRTSTLTLPVFVLAVLAAVTYAVRRFGRELRSTRTIVVTGLMVAGSATLAAVALSTGSAAYDFSLQSAQLEMMQGMPNGCSPACLGRQRWLTAGAHGRAILYTSAALLVTNVMLVGWLIAMRGGRLTVVRSRRRSRSRTGVADGSRGKDVRLLLVAGLLASAAIHAAVAPEHLQEWLGAGVFFVVLTMAELAAAAIVFMRRQSTGLVAAAVVSAGPLVVWVVSRTAGLPLGPEAGIAEPVGLADCVACLLELGTLVGALLLLRREDRAVRPPLLPHHRALALAAVVAVGALGLGGAAPGWFDGIDGGAETAHHHD